MAVTSRSARVGAHGIVEWALVVAALSAFAFSAFDERGDIALMSPRGDMGEEPFSDFGVAGGASKVRSTEKQCDGAICITSESA